MTIFKMIKKCKFTAPIQHAIIISIIDRYNHYQMQYAFLTYASIECLSNEDLNKFSKHAKLRERFRLMKENGSRLDS